MIRTRTPRAGVDRWLVSYADFTTLLLVFFMALYAASDLNPSRLETAADSVRHAFGDATIAPATLAVPRLAQSAETPRPLRVAADLPAPRTPAIAQVRERIEQELAGAITAGRLEIGADERGLVLSLPESATFSVASAEATPAAQRLIDRVAATLEPLDVTVRIEGHTDTTPIRTARYTSNWELSTARASAVVARFIDQRMDPRRLSAAGYGEFHPRASNDTAAGRASNRRIDVVVTLPPAEPLVRGQTSETGDETRDESDRESSRPAATEALR